MGKMSNRRRRKKKKKNKFAKLMKSLGQLKIRIPIPPIGWVFKSKTDYDRAQNKKIIERDTDEGS